MLRLSGQQSGSTFDIWLFDDHSEEHGGDHNLVSAWEDLLAGASTVAVQASRPTRDEDEESPTYGQIISQTPWVTFAVNLGLYAGNQRRVMRANLAPVQKNVEWLLRFSIDGGPWLGPISLRWTD